MTDTPNESAPVIKCPFCPVCGAAPLFIAAGLEQTWCTNEDCNVFMWVPWKSAAENLADQGTVRWFVDGVEQNPNE